MPVATFLQSLQIATEVDRGTAASTTHTVRRPWWAGGRWFELVTDGLPGLADRQANIFPAGHAGQRQINQQNPVQGRHWSDGDMSAPFTADVAGVLLLGVLGGLSTNQIPSGAPSLLNNEPINTNPKSFVLATQPDFGGNILRFDVKGTGDGGTISISGINAYGDGASELITFASAGLYWSRQSWSSIAASGLAISGVSAASVTIFGIRRYEHRFFTASSQPTISIDRIATPTAGGPSSRSKMHLGMLVKQMSMNTPADDDAGIFMMGAEFEGDPGAGCVAACLNAPSPLKIWPAWILNITRSGGTAWQLAKNVSLQIQSRSRNYKAAAAQRNPQGKFTGPIEITGNMDVILDNEVEFNNWQGASKLTTHLRWNTPWRLNGTSSINYELSASLPLFFENVTEGEDEDMFSLSADFRTTLDADWDIAQFILVNGTPGAAYVSGGVI